MYHGSNAIVSSPKILTNGYFKGFGYGFYCTNIENQAKRWDFTKHNAHIVIIYEYTPNDNLNMISFETMSKRWFKFIVNFRRRVKHDYDIVMSDMADDTIILFVCTNQANRFSTSLTFIQCIFFHKYYSHT